MTKNDSHVLVQHHMDDGLSNVKFMTMAFFTVIVLVIVLILLIILIVLVMMLKKYKCGSEIHNTSTQQCRSDCNLSKHTSRNTIIPRASDVHHTAEDDADSVGQNIPMKDLRRGRYCDDDSSESPADLCELLLTTPHEGQVVSDSPPRVLAFAGQVFPPTRHAMSEGLAAASRSHSKPDLSRKRPPNRELHKSSLEWDYYETRHYESSNESVDKNIVDVCWV